MTKPDKALTVKTCCLFQSYYPTIFVLNASRQHAVPDTCCSGTGMLFLPSLYIILRYCDATFIRIRTNYIIHLRGNLSWTFSKKKQKIGLFVCLFFRCVRTPIRVVHCIFFFRERKCHMHLASSIVYLPFKYELISSGILLDVLQVKFVGKGVNAGLANCISKYKTS